jgi:hypothetical protein
MAAKVKRLVIDYEHTPSAERKLITIVEYDEKSKRSNAYCLCSPPVEVWRRPKSSKGQAQAERRQRCLMLLNQSLKYPDDDHISLIYIWLRMLVYKLHKTRGREVKLVKKGWIDIDLEDMYEEDNQAKDRMLVSHRVIPVADEDKCTFYSLANVFQIDRSLYMVGSIWQREYIKSYNAIDVNGRCFLVRVEPSEAADADGGHFASKTIFLPRVEDDPNCKYDIYDVSMALVEDTAIRIVARRIRHQLRSDKKDTKVMGEEALIYTVRQDDLTVDGPHKIDLDRVR